MALDSSLYIGPQSIRTIASQLTPREIHRLAEF
jgi:hypothetical protein